MWFSMASRRKIIAGIAWFRSDQWQLLRSLAADADNLEETHAEWLVLAEKLIRDLKKRGIVGRKVVVDVNELNAWCISNNRPLDGSARAEYVVKDTPEPGET
jgi:hypothetical protein